MFLALHENSLTPSKHYKMKYLFSKNKRDFPQIKTKKPHLYELKQDAESYINFYNYHRFHQTLDYKRPMEVYDETKYKRVICSPANIVDNNSVMLQKVS